MAPTRILYVVTEDWYFLSTAYPWRARRRPGYESRRDAAELGKEAIEARASPRMR